MSFMLPPGKFTLSFHSTSFLQGNSRVTIPITIIMLIHAPACSHRTALNQQTDFFHFYSQTRRSFWAGHSNLPSCWVSVGFLGRVHPADHGASVVFSASFGALAVRNPVQAAGYLRSSVLPDCSATTTHWSQPRDRPMGEVYFSIQDTLSPKLGGNWTGPCSFGCTWAEALLLSGFCCPLVPQKLLPQSRPLQHCSAGCSLCRLPFTIHVWFDVPLRGVLSLSMSYSGISALSCRPCNRLQNSLQYKYICMHNAWSDLMHTHCHTASLVPCKRWSQQIL